MLGGRTRTRSTWRSDSIARGAIAFLLLSVATEAYPAAVPIDSVTGRGITLVDTLRMSEVSQVRVDGPGRNLYFQLEHYDRGDFSLESQSDMRGRIFAYDLQGRGDAHPLLAEHADWDGERLLSISPDGTYLVVSWVHRGDLKVGVYNRATHLLRELPFTPAFLQASFIKDALAWVSGYEFVCSALPPDESSGAVVFSRRAVEKRLTRLWEQSWDGKRASVDVLKSEAHDSGWKPRRGSLLRVDARTGSTQKLADGIFFALKPSPDGRYLAAAQQGGWEQIDPDKPFRNTDFRSDVRRYDAQILDLLRAGNPTRAAPGEQLLLSRFTWEWSLDSQSVVFYATPNQKRWSEGGYVVYDIPSGKTATYRAAQLDIPMVRELQDFRYERAVPMQAGIVVPARPSSSSPRSSDTEGAKPRLDWYLIDAAGAPHNLTSALTGVTSILAGFDERAITIVADGALWRIPIHGRAIRLREGIPRDDHVIGVSVEIARLSDPHSPAPFVAYTADDRVIFADASGRVSRTVALPKNFNATYAFLTRQEHTIIGKTDRGASEIALVDNNGSQRALFSYNTYLTSVHPAKKASFQYTLRDGSNVDWSLLLPPDLPRGLRPPVVVELYPGIAQSPEAGFYHPLSRELFTTMGYAVLSPYSPEEKIGDGDDLLGNWQNLVRPALDAAEARQLIDHAREGVYGTSAGGWSALALLTQTHRFKAAIVSHSTGNFIDFFGSGSSNLFSNVFPQEIFPARPAFDEIPGFHLSFGATLWDAPMRYVQSSPLFHINRIDTPLMLIQADFDEVNMDQSTQIFAALFRLRRDSERVLYWGEVHGLTSPANIRDSWARQLAWLDRWCDVVRDKDGYILYEGDRAKSRGPGRVLAPEDFLKWQWFFGPEPMEESANRESGGGL